MTTETRWLTDEEQHMWRSLQTMWRTLDRAVERDLTDSSGLSGADFSILVPLSEAPDRKLRARDLGLFLDWDRSRLSHQIRRMEQRQLVARSNCPTDARGTFIQLTDFGWETIQAAAPSHVETVRSLLFDVLTPADVAVLTDISERVSARIAGVTGVQTSCPQSASA